MVDIIPTLSQRTWFGNAMVYDSQGKEKCEHRNKYYDKRRIWYLFPWEWFLSA